MKQKTMCLLALGVMLAGVSVLGYTAISARAGEVAGAQTHVIAAEGVWTAETVKLDWSMYRDYGLTYDKEADQLFYEGQRIRWFEDYWPIDDLSTAGYDHFDAGGTVDVHGVRDLTNLKRNADGSFDPSGVLTGLAAFSQEEFDRRDVDVFRHPKATAVASERGDSPQEMAALYAVYAPYGLTYDQKEDCLYFEGKRVGYFIDELTSNGEKPGSGKFHGVLRSMGDEDGTISVRAIRDYTKPDKDGYGTLTGVERFERED